MSDFVASPIDVPASLAQFGEKVASVAVLQAEIEELSTGLLGIAATGVKFGWISQESADAIVKAVGATQKPKRVKITSAIRESAEKLDPTFSSWVDAKGKPDREKQLAFLREHGLIAADAPMDSDADDDDADDDADETADDETTAS